LDVYILFDSIFPQEHKHANISESASVEHEFPNTEDTRCTQWYAHDILKENACWFIINHDDNKDVYTLSFFLDLSYVDLVLLLTEACLFTTSYGGERLDHNQMSGFVLAMGKDMELSCKKFEDSNPVLQLKAYHLLCIGMFPGQSFNFVDQVSKEKGVKTHQSHKMIDHKAAISHCC